MKIFLFILLAGCSVIGKKPSGEHLEKIKLSPQWDRKLNKFINRNQADYEIMIKNFDYWGMTKEQFFAHKKTDFQSLNCQRLFLT